ncbi:MAG: acylphosphatase [Verrucomicrobiales bacterium]
MPAELIHFEGHVQGVGFRFSTKEIAMGYEVTGSVKNLPDGRVELFVQAETQQEIDGFLEAIQDSSLRGHIKRFTRLPQPEQAELVGFSIAH